MNLGYIGNHIEIDYCKKFVIYLAINRKENIVTSEEALSFFLSDILKLSIFFIGEHCYNIVIKGEIHE